MTRGRVSETDGHVPEDVDNCFKAPELRLRVMGVQNFRCSELPELTQNLELPRTAADTMARTMRELGVMAMAPHG